jgi:hypothetical protein
VGSTRREERFSASATTRVKESFSSTTSTGWVSPGRRVKVWMPSTMSRKAVARLPPPVDSYARLQGGWGAGEDSSHAASEPTGPEDE